MIKRINIFFPCLLGFYLISSIVFSNIVRNMDISVPNWILMIISQVILLIPVLVYVLIYKINIPKAMPYRKIKPLDALLSFVLGYTLIPLILVINYISMLFATNHMNSTISFISSYPFLVQIVLIAVIPALVEEFVFRGVFYHSYRKNGILGAALMSAIVFGVMHLNINQMCYALVMGIVFAIIVEATGNMWCSVITHFAINTYSISIMKLISILGIDINATVDTAAQTNPAMAELDGTISQEAMQIATMIGFVIVIVLLIIIAAAFTALAFLIIRGLAKRNGRWEYLKENIKFGFKRRTEESFVTIPYVATVVAAFVYMIITEFF